MADAHAETARRQAGNADPGALLKDRYANANRIQPEVAKTAAERGKYLNPELYGKSRTQSVVRIPRELTAQARQGRR